MNHNKRIITNKLKLKAMIVIVAFNLFCAISCDKNEFCYAEYAEIENENWCKKCLIQYDVSSVCSVDKTQLNDLILSIRHSNDYQYKELWLEVRKCSYDSIEYVDTIKLDLLSSVRGSLGKGYGGIYEINHLLYNGVRMNGVNNIKVRHIMADSILKGVNSIGILIKSKNN